MTQQRERLAAAEHLAGRELYFWQRRLLFEHLLSGKLPDAIDIPTGLGKTTVMALWLAALAQGAPVPRRLVYVVDRRAVVDQATAEAERLAKVIGSGDTKDEATFALRKGLRLSDGRKLPVSTLRGQHVANRLWLEHPALPAIVVGTVDMIGSRLLFSGYGVSRRMRPVHAGLLGVDALVVLDEAHLVPPFESLVRQIQGLRRLDSNGVDIPPFRVMALSATGRTTEVANIFHLRDEDMWDPRAKARLDAVKRLRVAPEATVKDLQDHLASRAWDLAQPAAAVIVFCNSRKTAVDVAGCLNKKLREAHGPNAQGVELLVGERRFRERERLVESHVFRRFLPRGSECWADGSIPAFLVATSAGEVGVDLDADHMVCDLVPWERMVQRLGRVNRRPASAHEATIEVMPVRITTGKDEAETEIGIDQLARLRAPFQHPAWPPAPDGTRDASAGSLHLLRQHQQMQRAMRDASTPDPLWPELMLPLVYAWSMTSVREHSGRPDIQPWLRGWTEEEPQTRVAWRRWFPLRRVDGAGSVRSEHVERELEQFFEEAPPHLVESLEAPTYRVVRTLRKRAADWLAASTRGADPIPHEPIVVVLDGAGDVKGLLTCGFLTSQKPDRLHRLLAGKAAIVDARLGGLNESGLLDENATAEPSTLDQEDEPWPRLHAVGFRVRVGPPKPPEDAWRIDYRWPVDPQDDSDERIELRVEVWRGDSPSQGDPALARMPQELSSHIADVLAVVDETAQVLDLPQPLASTLARVAELHDSGKSRPLWQRAMGARPDGRIYAKTDGRGGNPRLLQIAGETFRHEFGSLLDTVSHGGLDSVPDEFRDMALHLIASHHGMARPVITAVDPDVPPSACPPFAQEAARRFERLNRSWGPWELAWIEALFRAADWKASAEQQQGAGTS